LAASRSLDDRNQRLPGNLFTSHIYTVTFTTGVPGLNVPLMSVLGANGTTAAISAVADGGIGTLVNAGGALDVDGGRRA